MTLAVVLPRSWINFNVTTHNYPISDYPKLQKIITTYIRFDRYAIITIPIFPGHWVAFTGIYNQKTIDYNYFFLKDTVHIRKLIKSETLMNF